MSIEVNNLRVTKLREYLFNIVQTINEQYKQINVNFLSNEIDNYSLDKIPTPKGNEGWIIGDILKKEIYSFKSRTSYSEDVLTNLENVGFFETFESIIEQNNDNNILPDIKGIESIECSNCGSMNRANTNTAEFEIQIQIEYRKVNNESVSL